jgi:hypothetical protein
MSATSKNTGNTSTASSIREMTPEQTADAIKNIAKRIREESAKMRESVKVIRQSGAIEELTDAVREAAMAARDSAREINEVATELKQRGVINDTINAAEETGNTAREVAQTVKDTVSRKPQVEAKAGDTAAKTSPA